MWRLMLVGHFVVLALSTGCQPKCEAEDSEAGLVYSEGGVLMCQKELACREADESTQAACTDEALKPSYCEKETEALDKCMASAAVCVDGKANYDNADCEIPREELGVCWSATGCDDYGRLAQEAAKASDD